MTTDFSDADAQRIADRGREALIERLRPAFHETARQHSDILKLDDDQIEGMIQRAADRADGLQWRRALASVATEELGLSLGEALSSPVVARAQELAGAPSYEEALSALGLAGSETRTPPAPAPAAAAAEPPANEPVAEAPETDAEPELAEEAEDETDPQAEEEPERALDAEPDPDADAVTAPDTPAEEIEADEFHDEDEDEDEEPVDEPGDGTPPEILRLEATHLGGIATLEAGEQNLELRIGAHGLDIARKPGRVLGRLRWREIRTLEVQTPRGLRRRRRGERAHLVIRTQHGDASFEVPGVSEESLQTSLAPLLEHYGQH